MSLTPKNEYHHWTLCLEFWGSSDTAKVHFLRDDIIPANLLMGRFKMYEGLHVVAEGEIING